MPYGNVFSKKYRDLRNLAGVLVKDCHRYEEALSDTDEGYLALCNRDERLEVAPNGKGYRCVWNWTSDLHAPKCLPRLGKRLMKRALENHPICRATIPQNQSDDPDISFIIGHRGIDRLPNLLVTLESIAGQKDARFECIVIEQSETELIRNRLPSWVRYIHTLLPDENMPYCRAWAFNVGAKAALGQTLVLHDNDMMVPFDYAKEISERVNEGYEAINLKRFIFYLSQGHSVEVVSNHRLIEQRAPEVIVQNLEAGGSVAINRDSFFRLGGFDESFVGWGGEDNEFWERVQTLKTWPYGYLPIVHLWHAPQSGKLQHGRSTISLYETRSAIPAAERVAELTARNPGNLHAPFGR